MDMRNFDQCKSMTRSPSWTFFDLVRWKYFPQVLGGDRLRLRRFKDAWVKKNSSLIRSAALRHKLPAELLAGICWIEVGGDPNVVDRIIFEVRAVDWSGPEFIDSNFAVTHPPARTSFGFVSMQLRTAARTMGLNAEQMTISELRALSRCLEIDVYNIDLAALHLRQLAEYDDLPIQLSMNDVRIVGTRYNRGINPSLESIMKDTRHGDFIVINWHHFTGLVW